MGYRLRDYKKDKYAHQKGEYGCACLGEILSVFHPDSAWSGWSVTG
jgi:hypothetical protein